MHGVILKRDLFTQKTLQWQTNPYFCTREKTDISVVQKKLPLHVFYQAQHWNTDGNKNSVEKVMMVLFVYFRFRT